MQDSLSLHRFMDLNHSVVQILLTQVKGSAPRAAGTTMYVSKQTTWGTIGGGQLEFMMIERARQMLATHIKTEEQNIPLGPEIGQCCGGRVWVSLTIMTLQDKNEARAQQKHSDAGAPHIYVMGAGHVGRALTLQLQHLPVRCILIDTRANELALSTAHVENRLSALPEHDIQTAPAGSVFVVLTHDHALDFLLTSEALQRGDAAYVGMIGSATKRAQFENWHGETGLKNLYCPIGTNETHDKRPSTIAAFTIAEMLSAINAN